MNKSTMTRRERHDAWLANSVPDRLPALVWLHFGTEHRSGEDTADAHERFYRFYDWDVCKVMNDYRFPVPPGVDDLTGADAMRAFEPVPMTAHAFAQQLACIASLRRRLGPDWPIWDTLFEPVQQALRRLGFSRAPVLWANPEAAMSMLEAICRTLETYIVALKDAGCDGVLYSVNGAIRPPGARGISADNQARFLTPFDLRLLEAAKQAGLKRILHVHGTHLDMASVREHPCEAVSVSDRLPGNPSLREVRALYPGVPVMGGLHELLLVDRNRAELDAEIEDSLAQAGPAGFFLSSGCTVPSQTPRHVLEYVRAKSAAMKLG